MLMYLCVSSSLCRRPFSTLCFAVLLLFVALFHNFPFLLVSVCSHVIIYNNIVLCSSSSYLFSHFLIRLPFYFVVCGFCFISLFCHTTFFSCILLPIEQLSSLICFMCICFMCLLVQSSGSSSFPII